MPSRLNTGYCLGCGTILVHPYNDYQSCTVCTKKIQQELYQLAKRQRAGEKKKDTAVPMSKGWVNPQEKPLGQPVD
ncbi:hypothetical protein KAR91_84495 [Candidatus Pacearchaeota archaeon]|nr:hypothetical protein [Candidatus Pacearchaeota archaeon]